MSFPDIPLSVKQMLATVDMRQHHQIWHAVRRKSTWDSLPPAQRQQLVAAGWQPPRFEDQPGSGVDFLGMHREMIAHVNQALAVASDVNWPKVTAWSPIPWAANDADWPVPNWPAAPQPAVDARSATRVQQMKSLSQNRFQNSTWLASVSVDQLGTNIEWTIHGWMHMRWSGPPFADQMSADPANDWLYDPWSSHVNKTFWKLHGWIDERIGDWERSNHATADLSHAWSGPSMHHAHVAARETALPSTNLIDISAFKSIRFRFSQARVDRLLGVKKATPPGKKKSPKKLKKRKKASRNH
jgi:hypothetical protein